MHAQISQIEYWLPPRVETNDDLKKHFPDWDVAAISAKTGIERRHIADAHQCASVSIYTDPTPYLIAAEVQGRDVSI